LWRNPFDSKKFPFFDENIIGGQCKDVPITFYCLISVVCFFVNAFDAINMVHLSKRFYLKVVTSNQFGLYDISGSKTKSSPYSSERYWNIVVGDCWTEQSLLIKAYTCIIYLFILALSTVVEHGCRYLAALLSHATHHPTFISQHHGQHQDQEVDILCELKTYEIIMRKFVFSALPSILLSTLPISQSWALANKRL
jgi:hypothetical protein